MSTHNICRGVSNEYQQLCFYGEIKTKLSLSYHKMPSLSVPLSNHSAMAALEDQFVSDSSFVCNLTSVVFCTPKPFARALSSVTIFPS